MNHPTHLHNIDNPPRFFARPTPLVLLAVLFMCVGCLHRARAQSSGYVDRLNTIPTANQLRTWHEMVASKPHMAGSSGDRQVIASLRREFERMGFDVEIHWFYPYLSFPRSAQVTLLTTTEHQESEQTTETSLPINEPPIEGDPYSADPDLPMAFNTYSESGEVTGQLVYANYGRKEDFDKLKELGVDCTGKIVIARYGGNYRGFKARFAQQAGAIGLLLYLDPADSGFVKGEPYPKGGWATDRSIQRGSILELPWPGDPLTPGIEATQHAKRLNPNDVALPTILVQPIGWGAAQRIMQAFVGDEVPQAWRGGMDLTYRLQSSRTVQVRLRVTQVRKIKKTANVIATIKGELYPDEWVIVGCHHDAWSDGASDPTSGLISLLECARSVSQRAAQGDKPARTIVFAAWGAEEFGIIGSTEWVEAHTDQLDHTGIAYINLDMASMGPNFGASSSPVLNRVVEQAAHRVPQARDAQTTVYQAWLARSPRADDPTRPAIGTLGGGSDHVGFLCHVGIPSIALHAGGSDGTAYHSAYDDLHWYRQVVGDDYEPALMITRMTNAVVGLLADRPMLGYNFADDARVVKSELKKLQPQLENLNVSDHFESAISQANALEQIATDQAQLREQHIKQAESFLPLLERITRNEQDMTRLWIGSGLPDRPWYRNIQVATDPTSGYGSMMLPALHHAITIDDHDQAVEALDQLTNTMHTIEEAIQQNMVLFTMAVNQPE